MKSILIIMTTIFLISCASDREPRPPYIEFNLSDVVYSCNDGECGAYPELMKCGDGSPARNLQCLFVENVGCQWVGDNCVDAGVDGNAY